MNSSPCNKYELDRRGNVRSCYVADMCATYMAEPKCVMYYRKDEWDFGNSANAKLLAFGVALLSVGSQWV